MALISGFCVREKKFLVLSLLSSRLLTAKLRTELFGGSGVPSRGGSYKASDDPNLCAESKRRRSKVIWDTMNKYFCGKRDRTGYPLVAGDGALLLDSAMTEGLVHLFEGHRDYLLEVARRLEVTGKYVASRQLRILIILMSQTCSSQQSAMKSEMNYENAESEIDTQIN